MGYQLVQLSLCLVGFHLGLLRFTCIKNTTTPDAMAIHYPLYRRLTSTHISHSFSLTLIIVTSLSQALRNDITPPSIENTFYTTPWAMAKTVQINDTLQVINIQWFKNNYARLHIR